MYTIINEGKIRLLIPKEQHISKKLPVFYNPVMELNRTVSVLILNSINKKQIQIALPLAGTGVRGLRFLKELNKGIIKTIEFNDINPESVKVIQQNLKLNKIKNTKKIFISNKDANLFFIESKGFDYIDIDPFGSPNFLLDCAIKRLARNGILAVTATDTGCLCGSFPKACKRKYWAVPQRDDTMHENGLRILIRKIQLIGADHDKALTPIYSYSKDHYFRVFFRCEKGKQKVDNIIKQHEMFNKAGPLWAGQLWDKRLASDIAKMCSSQFLRTIADESKISTLGFYNIPKICRKHRLTMTKQLELIKKIKNRGYGAAKTHFAHNSLRSNIPLKDLIGMSRTTGQ